MHVGSSFSYVFEIRMPTIKQRGGARRGAGRNPLPAEERRLSAGIKLNARERVLLFRTKQRLGLSGSECVGILLSLFDAKELHD